MNLLLTLLVAISPCIIHAQELTIGEWQSNHPEVLFIEQEVFDAMSDDQQKKIRHKVIVYSDSIEVSDIEAYLEVQSSELAGQQSFDYADPNADYIKQWLGQNKDVLILTSENFNLLNPEQQAKVLESDAIILNGEFLTLDKISDYEAKH